MFVKRRRKVIRLGFSIWRLEVYTAFGMLFYIEGPITVVRLRRQILVRARYGVIAASINQGSASTWRSLEDAV
jgi:hypothetical protein